MKVNQLNENMQVIIVNALEPYGVTKEQVLNTELTEAVLEALEAANIITSEPAAKADTNNHYIEVTVTKGHKDEALLTAKLSKLGYRFIKSQGVWKKDNNRKQRIILSEVAQTFSIEYKSFLLGGK